MSDQNNGGSDTGQFFAFCLFVVVVTSFFLPSIVLLMPFHGFSLSESITIALREPICFIGSLMFWFFLLFQWAKKKG